MAFKNGDNIDGKGADVLDTSGVEGRLIDWIRGNHVPE
jgi:hypothetical protein